MDQYMALSKKDLVIHITLNELYNTHSLILQHVEVLVSPRSGLLGAHILTCTHSHRTTNSTFVFLPTSLERPQRRYLARRTVL